LKRPEADEAAKKQGGNEGEEEVIAGDDDWRLRGQEEFRGTTFYRRRFAPRPGDDHDHCHFCWAKFMVDYPDTLREGYTTTKGAPWVCDQCFIDFRDRFGWREATDPPHQP
jgi:hypothetical protein